MALQTRLPFVPPDAQPISPELAIAVEDGWSVLYHAGGPILSFREDDAAGRRLAAAVFSHPSVNIASPKALAEGLEIHRTMVFA